MKYYLCTTGISEIWDLDNELLLLGPWCLTEEKNKKLLEHKKYTIVSSPWRPAIKIKEAADYCHQVYEELLPQVSESLNSIHKVSYPVRYWRILLGPWLFCFIGVLYDRYKRVERALKVFPDFYTNLLPQDQYKLVTYDFYDFYLNKTNEDYFNLKLFSLIASALCPHNVNIIEKDNNFESKMLMHSNRHSWKRKLFYRLIKSLDLFFKCPIVLCDMYHLTPKDMVWLKLKGRFKIFGFIDFEPMKKALSGSGYSYEIRNAIKLKGDGNKFQSLLYRILPEFIPMCYMENYNIYKNYTRRIRNINSVRVVGSSVGWFFNEEFKFFASEAVSKGAKLIDFQHGGGYGWGLSMPNETISLEKDIFYTWGWSSKEGDKIKPLPSPHLSRLKDMYSPRFNDILFVGIAVPRYHYSFHTILLPDDMPKYFADKKKFFQALSDKIRNNVLYRPSVHEYGWKELEIVKDECPNVKFILKGKLIKWMKKAKLVVIDHPHTSIVEALTINVPCIFYWDHNVYLMRNEAEKYFKLLRDTGILFRNPLSAAEKVKEIFDDPMKWWLTDDVCNARLEFCKMHAYARKDWSKIWIKELKQLQNLMVDI